MKRNWTASAMYLALVSAGVLHLGVAAAAAGAAPKAAEAAADAKGETLYTVQPGDTLSSIAKAQLNDTGAWKRLQALNKIADPDVLRPGTSLRLPRGKAVAVPVQADVVLVKGDVRVRPSTGATFVPLASGTQLSAGAVIETGATGLLTLRFADRSRMLVTPNSRLVLTQLLLDAASGTAVTRATLEAGDVESSVTPLRGIKARYEVTTPTLNLAVRGTVFRVQFDEAQGTTRAMVNEGLVKAGNSFGETAIPAGSGTTAERGRAPLAPRPLLPAPQVDAASAVVEAFPLGVAWQQTPGAGQYRVELLEGGNAESLVDRFAVDAPASHWRRLPNGDYRLRIRGVDEAHLEGSNAEVKFKVQAWPPAPFIAAPAEGAVVAAERVKFRWARVQDAEYLRFQVARDAGFANLVMDVRNLTGKSNGLSVPLAPGHYYWRIAAGSAADGLGPFGAIQSFDVKEASAGSASAQGRSLRWREAAAGERYVVQMARQENFVSPVVDAEVRSTEVAVPGNGLMYVRIKRIAADGYAGDFEATQFFDAASE
ncbi:MAG TPA: FecR domain-containing protein [Rhodocyclaceae bacterium]|nr:FecR domain-containing protein [Rhodocyclaceae bacterium]